ncbi:hypothetical protein [robinz microvirus RP_62]|nr:hypothetical protein [robinz microvirus RP_62]
MRRKAMSNGKSRKLFTRTARSVNRKNVSPAPMRGGIRL